MPGRATKIRLIVNGTPRMVEVDPSTPLVFVLRNEIGLMGTKHGCGLEQCGACAILVDGAATLSCVRAVSEFADKEIVTIEGLATDGRYTLIQQAFIEEGAAQCGYCTPGIIIALSALIARTSSPDRSEIEEALQGHLCRCGSHASVLRAIHKLVDQVSSGAV
jgi:aerobic-type carbon monoxide dehydrogenase small subunit (CoxS/CutS family)